MSVTIPTVETDRLILREQRLSDLDAFVAFFAGDRAQFVGGPCDRVDVWRMFCSGAGHWQLRGYGIWHVADRETGAPMGFTGVLNHIDWPEPELAYTIFDRYEGKGIAFEAASAARRAAATHFGLTRLISLIAPENTRSQALARRLGAAPERDTEIRGHACTIWRHPEEVPA
ncbi:GNAT family N-acetyltransferase [Aestuariicoccus sp. MJ-SS9]|uniref:GNAT family N-acetyltransferase n=1 Tax=Aestuariicoccus sp. MJ-SS9 TaxID=3079855 RepID=UPI0029125189|nr:GNAT family N-acetyltransferase [Aestuariicoccus sp. MJ-SS9]MDU8912937.1 GNAT family N-acetyltransferase [Aestuariicoccus sp. MJ-SS9]